MFINPTETMVNSSFHLTWCIDCYSQIDYCYTRKHQSHLTNANCPANATVLRWNYEVLFRNLLFLSHFYVLWGLASGARKLNASSCANDRWNLNCFAFSIDLEISGWP
jgi:hypothetical protein